MPFRPIGERHAIEEVVFMVGFKRNFSATEIERVVEQHALWKSDLPKLLRPQMIQVIFDADQNQEAEPSPPIMPAAFQSFKRDGSVDWQLKIEDNVIAVNCLSYSRWDAISHQAKTLLEKVLGLILDEGNSLQNVTLQYIDSFIWSGDLTGYNVDALFNRESGFFPNNFKPIGPLWHFHQGEFEYFEGDPVPKRILDRIHLDATQAAGEAKVRIDTTLRSDFNGGVEATLDKVREVTQSTLNLLHSRNKVVLERLICDEMQQQISLNKES